MRRLLLVSVLLLAACGDDVPAILDPTPEPETQPATAAGLDSLAREGVPASLDGRVVEQELGARRLLLDDGTGLVWVELPEAPPPLVGRRLFVRGPLVEDDSALVLRAVEWLYDSTAISVRSD